MTEMLSTLPKLPERMQRLPIDARGYPVPWFVTWLDDKGVPCKRGTGTPDFRVITRQSFEHALGYSRCWLCGEPMGRFKTFVIGPMCIVNRVSAEPPSHLECADYAARACPFLSKPNMHRRTNDLPPGTDTTTSAGGIIIPRNPKVIAVWTTLRFRVLNDGRGGAVVRIGDPEHVRWYSCGREATRAEVIESIDSGLPELMKVSESNAERAEIKRARAKADQYLPAESSP